MPHIAFIGLSANLPSSYGPPAANLERALEILRGHAEVLAISELYRTTPLGVCEKMPDFLNQVVKISWSGGAGELLRLLLETENQLERKRPADKSRGAAARTLDLDLLLFGGQKWELPELTVPHPRMFQRAFVLVPLLDIWTAEDEIPGVSRPGEFLENCLRALDWSIDNRYIIQND